MAYQWAVVGVSPFRGGVVVGGKGGAMMMVLVGLPTWAESIERRPRACPLTVDEVRSYPRLPASSWNGSGRNLTTTPTYTHSQHDGKRPGAGGRSTPGTQGNHRITQLIGRRTYGGWSWEALARCASIHGGNTPPGGWSFSRIADGTRSTDGEAAFLWELDRIVRGAPSGAQPFHGG